VASRYRTCLLLTGLVALGWAWDLLLGGGRQHSAAWLGALVLVGGISALATGGSVATEADAGPSRPEAGHPGRAEADPSIRSEPGHPIRLAVPADLEELIAVEVAADKLFEVAGYGATPGPATLVEFAEARLLLVAGEPPVGYVRVEIVDGQSHLEGLSVRPKFMRQGLGTALVNAACEWATEQGFSSVTLCTFAEVPWNGPFYAGLGFDEIAELTPALQALRDTERRLGLDAMGRRCVLRRQLRPTGQSGGEPGAEPGRSVLSPEAGTLGQ
jgi:GNAT superfamily N-acetyltransferase